MMTRSPSKSIPEKTYAGAELMRFMEYEEEVEQSCCDKEEVIENENVHQG